jgi:mitochondrial enoyl-[acyl-carrier protein] reductase / trans-2-enoyl-CoA reductase
MKAIRFSQFGVAAEVAELIDLPDPGQPAAGEVLVDVEASPIQPADLLQFSGRYGATPPPLPVYAGGGAAGRVTAIGAGVTHLRTGDRVMVSLRGGRGNWRECVIAPADKLFALPDADPIQLSLLSANPPTAWLMLRKFVDLKPGDWVIQNAGNSSVGLSVIQLAKAMNVRCINVVRRAGLDAQMKEYGADAVVVDSTDLAAQVARIVGDRKPKLGIDAVAGDSVGRLASTLADDGVVVNYGLLSGQDCRVAPSDVVFRNVSLRGFWFSRWMLTANRDEVKAMFLELASMVVRQAFRLPVEATYPLARIHEALAHAAREGRRGKIVLLPNAK